MPRYEDDDRPRKRRPRDDEDDDDRPRKRRVRDDDADDERPSSARRRARDRDEDDYDDRPRKKKKAKPRAKEMSPLGLVGMIVGILALVVATFMPCFASWSLIISGLGIVLSFIALAMAQKSDGRYGMGMPITGLSLSGLAVVIAVLWLVVGKKIEKEADRMGKEWEAQEEAEFNKLTPKQKEEILKIGKEREAARDAAMARVRGAMTPPRLSAVEFAAAYDRDPNRANSLYGDKVIELTGIVDEVDLETSPSSFIVYLKTQDDEAVSCHFLWNDTNRARLQQLRPGTPVVIRGLAENDVASLDVCMLVE
jgi:hypothetical protein